MLPKIHVYTIVRNEEQMMPWFMRHYSAFADRIYVFDDISIDRTAAICDQYEKCVRIPYNIGCIDDAMFTHIFSEFYKGMSRGKCDWVICVDADEFIYRKNGVAEYLERYSNSNYGVVVAQGWQMVSERRFDPKLQTQQLTGLIDKGFYDDMYSKPCIFSPNIDLAFHPGRHGVEIKSEIAHYLGVSELQLLHYRYFGPESVIERNLKNTMHLSKNNYKNGHGVHNLPSNTGKYSPEWWKKMAKEAKPCLD